MAGAFKRLASRSGHAIKRCGLHSVTVHGSQFQAIDAREAARTWILAKIRVVHSILSLPAHFSSPTMQHRRL